MSWGPSSSQIQALEDIRDHGNPWWRVRGQSQHGGWSGVIAVILRNGWAQTDDTASEAPRWKLTDAGRAALERSR